METLTIDIQNEQEKKVLLAFFDSLNYHYRTDNEDYELTEEQIETVVQRKNDFLQGKTTARPWSEIKKRYEGV
ncbi:hypothetical protein [Mucilaginibacter psychrotolerans]|uniref:Addiction module protein n=1 Tax=Mucilaginibacter psychrotolerans TaxID=1524096 RepID=A0A4Y8SFC3_9SPHI|nr:hypothetical protein [Mucilaginibacter psychrotolerans]TFF37330.1 hypothetical protein E2R66_12930 [Mucilaginibacter psychrotolerans]